MFVAVGVWRERGRFQNIMQEGEAKGSDIRKVEWSGRLRPAQALRKTDVAA